MPGLPGDPTHLVISLGLRWVPLHRVRPDLKGQPDMRLSRWSQSLRRAGPEGLWAPVTCESGHPAGCGVYTLDSGILSRPCRGWEGRVGVLILLPGHPVEWTFQAA